MSDHRSSAKSSIEKLVRFFEQNIYQLKSPDFNETQARQQLIDPFFEALGWDVHNRKMNPIYLQEVIPEGRVKTNIGKEVKEQQSLSEKKGTPGKAHREYASILDYIAEDNYKASWKEAIKKPDYRFRIKGQTKFFVEAKKPFVDLSKSAEAIFQVKRYGFSGRVPVSILTDFEQLRTFDCTHKPEYDKPNLGVIKQLDFTYKQYLDEFTQLYDTFSREAVEAGSLDTLTRKLLLKKTGDFALDKHFLEDLSKWREELARDIAKHPRNRRRLTDYTLNESVQRILDRIVFFRVCEDREIEVENTLLAVLRLWQGRSGVSLYSLLNDLFKQRRALYNGLLFAPHECEELEVGDDVILKILEGLNYPFSPYYFNEIGVEILGSIYEKFLGKTIHLTPKTVRIEEKPEVRKAGGVYYTPQYIVNYIVDNTVGKLLYEEGEGDGANRKPKLSPKQAAKLKIIDIACGSGSFLLGAFQKLIDYHIEWYREHPKSMETQHNVPDAYEDGNGNLRLSSRKKRDILLNNIYGVDIDRQAVEVTQMSLYLKVLEGENAETLNPQMTLALKEAYLPSLGSNIKCGNSLIGTDISAQVDLFDSESTQRLNPFDWDSEFTEIMRQGGFDVVMGNPPYGAEMSENEQNYLRSHYTFATYQIDTYAVFIEKGSQVASPTGRIGLIVPSAWVGSQYNEPMRRALATQSSIMNIVVGPRKVFEDAVVETVILIFSRPYRKGNRYKVDRWDMSERLTYFHQQDLIQEIPGMPFQVYTDPLKAELLARIGKGKPVLGSIAEAVWGVKVYQKGKGNPKQSGKEAEKKLFHSTTKRKKSHKPLLGGSEISRYSMHWEGTYVDHGPWLAEPRSIDWFTGPRILVREVTSKGVIQAALVDGEFVFSNSVDGVRLRTTEYSLRFLLAIINSRLISFCNLHSSANAFKESFPKVLLKDLLSFPLPLMDAAKQKRTKTQYEVDSLVEKMMHLNKQLLEAHFDSEKEPIQRQIAATDKKIDKLVYELYGLTDEEIKIVEGSDK